MHRPNRFVICFHVALLLTCAYAQRRGLSTNINSRILSVRIASLQGAPVQTMLVVRLQAGLGSTVAQVTTNNGTAMFSDLPAGQYQLQISGPSIEECTSPGFEIGSIESCPEEYVVVRPKTPVAANPESGGLISPADLKAPAGARQAYIRGNEALIHRDYKKAIQQFPKGNRRVSRVCQRSRGFGSRIFARRETQRRG